MTNSSQPKINDLTLVGCRKYDIEKGGVATTYGVVDPIVTNGERCWLLRHGELCNISALEAATGFSSPNPRWVMLAEPMPAFPHAAILWLRNALFTAGLKGKRHEFRKYAGVTAIVSDEDLIHDVLAQWWAGAIGDCIKLLEEYLRGGNTNPRLLEKAEIVARVAMQSAAGTDLRTKQYLAVIIHQKEPDALDNFVNSLSLTQPRKESFLADVKRLEEALRRG